QDASTTLLPLCRRQPTQEPHRAQPETETVLFTNALLAVLLRPAHIRLQVPSRRLPSFQQPLFSADLDSAQSLCANESCLLPSIGFASAFVECVRSGLRHRSLPRHSDTWRPLCSFSRRPPTLERRSSGSKRSGSPGGDGTVDFAAGAVRQAATAVATAQRAVIEVVWNFHGPSLPLQ
ncbi:unnamed protein product, partial [Scytosiphon promiscuus]